MTVPVVLILALLFLLTVWFGQSMLAQRRLLERFLSIEREVAGLRAALDTASVRLDIVTEAIVRQGDPDRIQRRTGQP